VESVWSNKLGRFGANLGAGDTAAQDDVARGGANAGVTAALATACPATRIGRSERSGHNTGSVNVRSLFDHNKPSRDRGPDPGDGPIRLPQMLTAIEAGMN
jgi:hypothetical protein